MEQEGSGSAPDLCPTAASQDCCVSNTRNGGAKAGQGTGPHQELSWVTRQKYWSGDQCKDNMDISLSHLAAAPPTPTRFPQSSKQEVEEHGLEGDNEGSS